MCTLTMPMDIELLGLAPTSGQLMSHALLTPTIDHCAAAFAKLGVSNTSDCWQRRQEKNSKLLAACHTTDYFPFRPCSILRSNSVEETLSIGCISSTEAHSPTRLKKKVVFADDRGLALEHVKVMTEPSDCPPKWTAAFLAQVTQGASAVPYQLTPTDEAALWETMFRQPAADYLGFRETVERQCVALENAVIRPQEECVSVFGTVKVKNISFHKEVFVRLSYDCWKTHQDVFATYVPCASVGGVYSVYDTFSFSSSLPPDKTVNRIEFCVGFRCHEREMWDSNSGQNFILVKKELEIVKDQNLLLQPIHMNGITPHITDAVHLRMDTWTEFASWHHLVTEGPYW